jgi:hypothetical protein
LTVLHTLCSIRYKTLPFSGGHVFGSFYQRRDAELTARAGEARLALEFYASSLLAELLDRAEVLGAARRSVEPFGGVGSLLRAIDLFLLDIDEARTRGLRARLFSRTETGALDASSVDPADDLLDLGGALVPADRLDATISVRI